VLVVIASRGDIMASWRRRNCRCRLLSSVSQLKLTRRRFHCQKLMTLLQGMADGFMRDVWAKEVSPPSTELGIVKATWDALL